MAHAATLRSDRTADLLKTLEAGVREVFSSGKFTEYLLFLGRFHKYSWSNVLLIQLQRPNASHVAGFNTWLKLGRTVTKGEHGIRILAPATFKKPAVNTPADLDSDVSSAATRAAAVSVRYFRTVSVFDISQTTGADLPMLAAELEGDLPDYEAMLQAIRDVAKCPIEFEPVCGGVKGYFAPAANRIVVKKGMSELQTIKTILHELAHERLHRDSKESRAVAEVTAESVAFTTASFLGLDTSSYSFSYLASWSSDEQLAELRKSLPIIQKASNVLISDLEAALAKNTSQHSSVAA
jgi:antirestriction protein ArdC